MISREEIEGLATLARIELREGEIESLQHDISTILDYIGQLSGETITAVTPSIAESHNVMRDDTPHAEGSPIANKREALLAALPQREGDYALVRQIITKDD